MKILLSVSNHTALTRNLILLVVLTILGNSITAQRLAIDSLKEELAKDINDTTRAMVLARLSRDYRFSDPKSGVFYGEQAYLESKKIGFKKGEVFGLGRKAVAQIELGDLPGALQSGFKALALATEYKVFDGYPQSLAAIGQVYGDIKDYSKAVEYFKRWLALRSDDYTSPGRSGYAYALFRLGAVFTEMDQLDSAVHYLTLAKEVFLQSVRFEPLVFASLGDVELKLGKHDSALDFYRQTLEISLSNKENRATSQAYLQIANLYEVLNQADSAIIYAKKSLEIAESVGQKKVIVKASDLLASLYESDDAVQALTYYKHANDIRETMIGAGNIQVIQDLIAKEEQRQEEIELAEAQYNNRLRVIAFLGSSFTLMAIALLLYMNNRAQKKSRRKTEIAYERLQNTQSQLIHSEKMASLGELTAGIAHEIQNPLNFVNNFSDVNKELIERAG